MKLFQQLLVAPAALGLMAPMAANASDLNFEGVSDYSAAEEQVTSASQFSDVYPTDWAYQALTELAERYGCVDGVAGANGKAMTRYEAAALLNACLDNVTEMTDDVRRLISEFGPELAVLKGRVDGLEAKVGALGSNQFSTTTKLRGKVITTVGGITYDDYKKADTNNGGSANDLDDGVHMAYTYQLDLNTSFTGEDLLYTRIKTGNNSNSPFGSGSTYLSWANSNADVLEIDKLWYQFPVGDNLQVWVGPKIENYYMLASSPSLYKPILKSLKLGGNGGVYGASTGEGFGAAWTQSVDDPSQPRFAISANYTASSGTGNKANPTEGGLMTKGSKDYFLSKLEYGNRQWQVSAAFSHKSKTPTSAATAGFGTSLGKERGGEANGVGLRAFWQPEENGAVPSISLGYDIVNIDAKTTGQVDETAAWMAGLVWKDAFVKGNKAGMAFGANQYATSKKGGGSTNDDNFVYEAFYTFKVTDNIAVTPAVFVLNDPDGAGSKDGDDIFGALVKTEIRF